MTKSKSTAASPFSRFWRDNFATLAAEIAASPLVSRQHRRSAGRQLAKQMVKAVPPKVARGRKALGPTWRVSRTDRRARARKVARQLHVPMVSRQFHWA
jgi:hypothetical protein